MKNAKSSSFVAPDHIIRAAGAWLARRDGGFTQQEQSAFDRWVAADSRHAAAVAQLELAFNAFDRLPTPREPGILPDPDVLAPRERSRWLHPFGGFGLAAAAAIAVVLLRPAVPTGTLSHHIASSRTATDHVTLSDGSVVTLNQDTDLKEEFSATERLIVLVRGEAHFEVAKDSRRPFVVVAGEVATRAVGTAFNVRLSAKSVEVLVTEGKVQLTRTTGREPLRRSARVDEAQDLTLPLTAGHRAVLPLAHTDFEPTITRLTDAEIGRGLAWQPRFRELNNASLAEIVAELNRQPGDGRPQIIITDPELAGLRLGGRIYADRPEVLVRLLENTFNLRIEHNGNTITLRRAP